MSWPRNIEDLLLTLQSLSVRDSRGIEIEPDAGFLEWENCTRAVREERKTVYLIGNGASASMASHVAADLAKNAHVHTEVFSDLSLITALANDLGYEEVFAEPLRRRMKKGDMLVAISSSGQSPNILRACRDAQKREGIVITLSAMKADNPLRSEGLYNFYLPASTYGVAETCHAAILHFWLDQMTLEVNPSQRGVSLKNNKRMKRAANLWIG